MSPWIYDNQEMLDISQFPKKTFGFVYRINHLPTDKSYIGKKVLFHNRKTKLGKKELSQYEGMVGRKPSFIMVTICVSFFIKFIKYFASFFVRKKFDCFIWITSRLCIYIVYI